MKMQPDTILATETPFAVHALEPTQMGMLRFERLNHPDWAVHYLSPACQNLIEVPLALQSGGCAGLIRPEASTRQQLHEQIQQQLAVKGYYQVHYCLTTASGLLEMVELGMPYPAAGSQILSGYLIPRCDDSETYQQQMARMQAQQSLLAQLSNNAHDPSLSLKEIAERILQRIPATLETQRGSLWLIQDGLFLPLAIHPSPIPKPEPQPTQNYPVYFKALQEHQVLAVQDTSTDPRTAERAHAFKARKVHSVLEAPLRNAGQLIGVLRLESEQARAWYADERAFAGELAEHLAQLVVQRKHQNTAHALQLFQQAIAQANSAFLLLDQEGRIEYANPCFARMMQTSPEALQGKRIADLPDQEQLSSLIEVAINSLACNSNWQETFQSTRKGQKNCWGRLSVSKTFDSLQQLTHYIVTYEDISEAKQAQRLVYTDGLTGLVNRSGLIHSLEEHFAQGITQELSLVLVDIDNFKRINDSLGHRVGDIVLARLGQRLKKNLGKHGIVARFASNEFAIVMDNMDFEGGLAFAQQILCALDDPIYIDGQLINLSASAGLACAPEHGTDPHALMKHAGLALHKAKANGKNQVQIFTQDLNAEADFRLFLENNLRTALSQKELSVSYQPKVCLRTGKLMGLEALMRWEHPERGFISPDRFIPVAEETGLILPIGNWAARQACRMAVQLEQLGISELSMAINLSPRQFSDPDLVNTLRNILQEEGLDPHRLELELTESLLLDATEPTKRKLAEFKAMGISLAMDDFGTGYSSLSYLKKFPLDVIKIDRSFIKDIPENQDDMEITSAVVAMARNLKLKVVAEGIESAQQLNFLRRHRCDVGQGYLFDKPIPGPDLLERLRRYAPSTPPPSQHLPPAYED